MGLLALASLIACVALPLRVAGAGMESHAAAHGWLKSWLNLPTLL